VINWRSIVAQSTVQETLDIFVMLFSFMNIWNFLSVFVFVQEMNLIHGGVLGKLILFSGIWWSYAFLFTIVIQNTWGWKMRELRRFEVSIFQVISTILFETDERKLDL
jgi:hypothetical protein